VISETGASEVREKKHNLQNVKQSDFSSKFGMYNKLDIPCSMFDIPSLLTPN